MVLSRVEVEPGAKLALHHHLGTQVANIEAGTLTYTVRRGGVVVRQGESDQSPRTVRKIAAGQTAPIRPGQWIVGSPPTSTKPPTAAPPRSSSISRRCCRPAPRRRLR